MAWPGKMAAVLWVAVGSSIIFGQAAKPLAGSRTLVRAGHLLDVKTGKILDGQTIVVTRRHDFFGSSLLRRSHATGRHGG